MIGRIPRLWQIGSVFRRYGLSEFAGRKPGRHDKSRGERLRLALQELGPVFIKFGQALSTRPDILPPDVAAELAFLQDRVEPFEGAAARAIVEKALGKPVTEVFAEFDETPLAAASIAQVHAARLKPETPDDPGFNVVVKVLRPDVAAKVEKDVALLRTLADLVERWHPAGKRLRPKAVVAEYEKVIFDELDLMREGGNCSLLRRNWLGSDLIYHPLVFWDYTRTDVLVMERIYGVSLRELDKLREMGVDFRVLAERGVEIFFKQVFRDNFFHADMHPGNIFVDVSDIRKPSYLAVDFGIVGQLQENDLRYLAENFLAFFNRDYHRVAVLHVESGWIPPGTRVEDFEAAIRTVCEPIFGKPIKDISFGFFLLRLFEIARRYNYQVQPQLVLLQKTLLTVEGLGRQLYPELDLWKTAKPIMEQWMWNRINPAAQLAKFRAHAPQLAEALPVLAQHAVQLLSRGQGGSGNGVDKAAIDSLRAEWRRGNRGTLLAIVGATSWIVAAWLLIVSGAVSGVDHAHVNSLAVTGAALGALFGTVCWWRAFRRA